MMGEILPQIHEYLEPSNLVPINQVTRNITHLGAFLSICKKDKTSRRDKFLKFPKEGTRMRVDNCTKDNILWVDNLVKKFQRISSHMITTIVSYSKAI